MWLLGPALEPEQPFLRLTDSGQQYLKCAMEPLGTPTLQRPQGYDSVCVNDRMISHKLAQSNNNTSHP